MAGQQPKAPAASQLYDVVSSYLGQRGDDAEKRLVCALCEAVFPQTTVPSDERVADFVAMVPSEARERASVLLTRYFEAQRAKLAHLAALEKHVQSYRLDWHPERYLRALRWAVAFADAPAGAAPFGDVHVGSEAAELGASRVGDMDILAALADDEGTWPIGSVDVQLMLADMADSPAVHELCLSGLDDGVIQVAEGASTLQRRAGGRAVPVAWKTVLMLAPPGSPLCPVPIDTPEYSSYEYVARAWNNEQVANLPRGGLRVTGVLGGFSAGEDNDDLLRVLQSANRVGFTGILDAARAVDIAFGACGGPAPSPVVEASVAIPFNLISVAHMGRVDAHVQNAIDMGRRLWATLQGQPNHLGRVVRVALA